MKSIIYCYIESKEPSNSNVKDSTGYDYKVVAQLNGETIAYHTSSSVEFVAHDIGMTSNWQHNIYKRLCPDGYELRWV